MASALDISMAPPPPPLPCNFGFAPAMGTMSAASLATVPRPATAASLPLPPLQRPSLARQPLPPPPLPPLSPQLALPEEKDLDPQAVSEYVPEILSHLFNEETAFMARPNYMESQSDINAKMRAILIDWLIEVHMKYKLRQETLFLTTNLIDRYLTLVSVPRRQLQLIGVVALFIASKFEEIHPPRVSDFVYITDNTYTAEDILNTECSMLSALGFQVVVPTAAHFQEPLQKANRCEGPHHAELANYILELTLIDLRMIRYPPSQLVSAALMLSNQLMGRQVPWSETLAQCSRHSEQSLRTCSEEMRALLRSAPSSNLQAVRKKYMHQQHLSVAKLPCATIA